jgi:hypothetical protein
LAVILYWVKICKNLHKCTFATRAITTTVHTLLYSNWFPIFLLQDAPRVFSLKEFLKRRWESNDISSMNCGLKHNCLFFFLVTSTIALCTIILLYICCQMLVGVIIGVMLPECYSCIIFFASVWLSRSLWSLLQHCKV